MTTLAAGAASDIDGASGNATATRAFAVGKADAVADDSFIEAAFAADAFPEAAFVEATFALEVEAEESEAEAGVDASEGRPCLSAAKADGDNSANSMAAMATLTSLPLGVSANARALSN